MKPGAELLAAIKALHGVEIVPAVWFDVFEFAKAVDRSHSHAKTMLKQAIDAGTIERKRFRGHNKLFYRLLTEQYK